jgi:hypothetical protein
VSADTIRYYSRIKMLKPSKETNGYYIYGQKELDRLRFILRAKQLGFSLADIQTGGLCETPPKVPVGVYFLIASASVSNIFLQSSYSYALKGSSNANTGQPR